MTNKNKLLVVLVQRHSKFYKFIVFCSCKFTDMQVENSCRRRPRNVRELLKFLMFGGFRENMRVVQQLSQEYRQADTPNGALNLAPSASETTADPTPSSRDEITAQVICHTIRILLAVLCL
jgi:hypothetical protein